MGCCAEYGRYTCEGTAERIADAHMLLPGIGFCTETHKQKMAAAGAGVGETGERWRLFRILSGPGSV